MSKNKLADKKQDTRRQLLVIPKLLQDKLQSGPLNLDTG